MSLALFLAAVRFGVGLSAAALGAFFAAALVNYYLSVKLIFRHRARWKAATELLVFLLVVATVGVFDMYCTRFFVSLSAPPWLAKTLAIGIGLVFNFAGRRLFVFPEQPSPDWKPQNPA